MQKNVISFMYFVTQVVHTVRETFNHHRDVSMIMKIGTMISMTGGGSEMMNVMMTTSVPRNAKNVTDMDIVEIMTKSETEKDIMKDIQTTKTEGVIDIIDIEISAIETKNMISAVKTIILNVDEDQNHEIVITVERSDAGNGLKAETVRETTNIIVTIIVTIVIIIGAVGANIPAKHTSTRNPEVILTMWMNTQMGPLFRKRSLNKYKQILNHNTLVYIICVKID